MGAGTALTTGHRWSKATVSWGDPRHGLEYGFSYRADFDGDGIAAPDEGFAPLGVRQVAAARVVLDRHGPGPEGRAGFAVEGFTALGLRYAADGGSADIRLANTWEVGTAYAYQPGGDARGGDVWFGGAGRNPEVGNYDYMTVLHEVGHALGLDHAHEGGRNGTVPRALDTPEFTVMSYRAWTGAPPGVYFFEQWGAPQTWMMLDIAALQELYGANFKVNADDTVYRWQPGSGRTWVNGELGLDPGGDAIFATIWDGGGRDRYDLSAYASDLSINLGPGRHSVFAEAQLADLGGGPNEGHARGSVFNALQYRGDRRSLIEEAVGGSGDDRIVGNAAGNRLCGGDGGDRLSGLAGRDVLIGGRGDDVFVLVAGGACDRLVGDGGAGAFEGAGRERGDRVDLAGVDADTTRGGDQAFELGDGTGPGRLWLYQADGTTFVCGNTDRDDAAEVKIAIRDGATRCDVYTAEDFLL